MPVETFYGNPADSDVDSQRQHRHHQPRAPGRPRDVPQPDPDRRLRPLLPEFRARRGERRPEPGGAHRLQQRHPAGRTCSTRPTSSTWRRPARFATPRSWAPTSDTRSPTTSATPASSTTSSTSVQAPFDHPTISTPVTFRQSATDADNHLEANVAGAFVQDQIDLSQHVQVIAGVRFDRFDLTYHNNRNAETLEPCRRSRVAARRRGLQADRAGLASTAATACPTSPSSGDQFSSLTVHHRTGEAGALQQLRGGREVGFAGGPLADDGGLSPRPHQHPLDRSQRSDAHRADRHPANQRLRAGAERARRAGVADRRWLRVSGRGSDERHHRGPRRHPGGPGAAPHTVAVEQLPVPSRLSGALGIVYRSDMFAAIDNTVTLPACEPTPPPIFR